MSATEQVIEDKAAPLADRSGSLCVIFFPAGRGPSSDAGVPIRSDVDILCCAVLVPERLHVHIC